MSSEKLYNQKKLETKKENITAVDIFERNLLTGDDQGKLTLYNIKTDNLAIIKETKFHSKIDKICIPPTLKIAFIQSGNEIFFVNIPKIDNPQSLFKIKDVENFYLNLEDPKYEKAILVLHKNTKFRIKIYEYEINDDGKLDIKEKKLNKQLFIDKNPDCAIWIKTYFVYSINKNKCIWLVLDNGTIKSEDEFEEAIDMFEIGDVLAVSRDFYTVFMQNGKSSPISMLMHESDLHCYSSFKNQLIALKHNSIVIYKKLPDRYEPIETIKFDKNEMAKFIVASKYKLIVLTTSGENINFIDFQEKPIEEQIRVVLDQKAYNKGIEILQDNIDEDDDEMQTKLENVFLDCGWACLEGDKKDYENAIKYLSLTNFNPFEFIYMFYDALKIKIIHKDKENDIMNPKNQFFSSKSSGSEQNKEAYKFLISILKLKRDYILEKLIKAKSKSENSDIEFMSSNRSKINLKDTNVTIGDTLYTINSTLIKCMIKLKQEPKEIEGVLDNETMNYTNLDDLKNDKFFSDDNNKNLIETKFTLSYILEKNGNYKDALKQWELFGKGKDEKYKIIGKDRTIKVFYKFKERKNSENEELFRIYIKWILENYKKEAFEVITQTEIVSNKVFMEEILPQFKSKKDEIKEQFLEYCNDNHRTENYQTLLIELYLEKIFNIAGKATKPKKIDGDLKKYYDLLVGIIKSKDSLYNKKTILEDIENSWLKEIRIYLYSQLKEYDKALDDLFKEAEETKSFKELEEFCKNNNVNPEEKTLGKDNQLYEKCYKLLSYKVRDYQKTIDDNLKKLESLKNQNNKGNSNISENIANLEKEIKICEEAKMPYEQEMTKLLKINDNMDPMLVLDYVNDHLNICQNKDFFEYLKKVVENYTIEANNYKISKNLSDISLAYKAKEEYEFKKKCVIMDTNTVCKLCHKKIGSTVFVVYPDKGVYHSKCALNNNIDPKSGIDFSKTNSIV